MLVQLQQQVEQLQKGLEELQGDKQTTDRENLHLKQKVEVEKFKTQLASTQGDLRKAQMLYENRLGDQLRVGQKDIEMTKREVKLNART